MNTVLRNRIVAFAIALICLLPAVVSAYALTAGIVFGVIAAVAVLIIVIQGIRFVLSAGDSQKAADARKGVIYAAVGLVVALSAEVVVRVVIGKL